MRNHLPRIFARQTNWRTVLLLTLGTPTLLSAQTEITTQTGTQVGTATAPALLENMALEEQRFQNENSPSIIISTPVRTAPTSDTPFKWGMVAAHPSLDYRFLYANNILRQPGNQTNSILQEVTPGVLFTLGNHWALSYSSGLKFYSDNSFKDTVDHRVNLQGEMVVGDWSLNLGQLFSSSSDPIAETGTQTDRKSYVTSIGAGHNFDNGFSLDLAVHQKINDVPQFSGSKEWDTRNGINYQFSRHFSAGVGIGFGYIDAETGSDMTFEELLGRMQWTPGEKLSVQVNGGGEIRQFLSGSRSSRFNPIFGTVINYQWREATSFSLTANRAIRTSVVGSQITENTDLFLSIRQRFFKKLYLDVSPGYRITDYENTTVGGTTRSDDNFFLSTRLSVNVLKKGRASIVYQWSENSSNLPGFDYDSNQVGFELGYRF